MRSEALLLDVSDIEKHLNQETLRITGLSPGRYMLSIDGNAVDTFSPEALEGGINLADYATPMFHQAQSVGWLVRDRDETHFVHARMRARERIWVVRMAGMQMQVFEDIAGGSAVRSCCAEAACVPADYRADRGDAEHALTTCSWFG